MGSKVAACAECSRNCLLIHRNHDPSLIVCSFFKVMYGKNFSDVVTVPPRFARLASLVAQKTYLEDSSGRKWNVILSEFNGSLAIEKGWNEFVEDHGIQLGDFVVFHYIMGSHFIVQIYGTHGCEKLSLSGDNAYQNKRAKTTEYTIATNACVVSELEVDDIRTLTDYDYVREMPVVASSQAKTSERLKKASTSEFPDDIHFIVNQDHYARDDERDYLFDLSIYEIPGKNVDANKANNLQIQGYRCSQVLDALQRAQTGAASHSVGEKQRHTAEGSLFLKHKEEFMSRTEYTPPNTCPRGGIPLSSNMPQKPVGAPSGGRTVVVKQEPMVCTPHIRGDRTGDNSHDVIRKELLSASMTQKSNWMLQNSELTAAPNYCQPPGTDSSVGARHNSEVSNSKEARTNNGDLGENLNHMVNDDSVPGMIVKPEPVDLCDSSSASITKITCLVQSDGESFLELPKCLPLKAYGQAAKVQPKLVFLQDPARRVWPVLYHQKHGLNFLGSGWRAFRAANNVQPGDKCTFAVENMDKGKFSVQILHSERS